jgi:outer membrane protein assembly factor BamA
MYFVRALFLFIGLLLAVSASAQDSSKHYLIRSLSISGNTLYSTDELLLSFSSKAGDTLREAVLEQDIKRTLERYNDNGYLLAKVKIEAVAPNDSGGLDISLAVEEGKNMRIGAMDIAGLASTDTDIVTREFSLSQRPYYSKGAVTSARNRVARLGIFSSVSEADPYIINDSLAGLKLAITEGNTTFIDGILGYSPPTASGGSGIVTGYVTLDFRNIGGTARQGYFAYRRESPSIQDIGARYREPWLFNVPLTLGAEFNERDEDSLFTRSRFGLDLTVHVADNTTLGALGAYESVIPGSAGLIYKTKALSSGLTLEFDTRNKIIAPTSGLDVSFSAIYKSKSISGVNPYDSAGEAGTALSQFGLNAISFIPTFSPRFIFVPKLTANRISAATGKLQENDLFRVGGIKTLRGYFESQFLTSFYGIGSLEYRLMFDERAFLAAFADFGYLEREEGIGFPHEVDHPLGYGIAFQLGTKIGILSVSIALAKGDPIDEAKLHFGILADF